MSRRFWLWCLGCSVGLVGFGRRVTGDEREPTLNEMLRSVLKCRRPQEFAYIDLVTQKVDSGELPKALVLSMMKWATEKSRSEVQAGRRRSDIPMPYFQEGLKRRAAEIGVSLPAFSP